MLYAISRSTQLSRPPEPEAGRLALSDKRCEKKRKLLTNCSKSKQKKEEPAKR
jgi:hypothetical protein